MNDTALIELIEIRKCFDYPIVLELFNNISLRVMEGESIAIVGKSGEGKSTLLNIIATLDKPTSGSVSIKGEAVSRRNVSRLRSREIGMIFQSFNIIEDMTVLDNVLMPSDIARMDRPQAILRAQHLLKKVGLSHREEYPCRKLSGGERQRVAIARAFQNNPALILADEPTGNLDHNTAIEIKELLFRCVQEEKKGLILVTHDESLAKRCQKTYRLESGNLSQIA